MAAKNEPARIGPYELIARLGSGGMADTFIALRHGPGGFVQRVCLKRLRKELERDPEFIRQFMAEATIAARLRHAAITQVLDFGRDGDDYYMALELIDGLDLRELLDGTRGRLSPELVLYIAIELATALDFAHRGGGLDSAGALVHRDVSTSNTLISTEGEVKLSDFGIARSVAGPNHTRTGIVKGKVPYMAPEYARTGRLDPRADLFSFGVLLYECLCGVRPHDGETDLQTLERASRGERIALAGRAPEVPAAFAALVEQLLEHDPELRVQSAGAALEALLALPAPVRARRDLGALVVELRAKRAENAACSGSMAPLQSTAHMAEAGAAGADGADGASEVAAFVRSSRPSRSALFVLFGALAFALGVGALSLARRPSAKPAALPLPAEVADSRAPSGPAAPALPTEAVSSPLAPSGEGSARPPAGQTAADARLEVIVLPFGEVTVDGRSRGPAPVTLKLEPGPHVVEASNQGRSIAKRRVTLTAGQHKQVVLQ